MQCLPPSLLLLPLLLLPSALAGPGDTVDQLRVGFSIVPLVDEVTVRLSFSTSPITTEPEACPTGWVDALIYGCFAFLEETNLTMMEAMLACEEVHKMERNQSFHLCSRLEDTLPSQRLPSR